MYSLVFALFLRFLWRLILSSTQPFACLNAKRACRLCAELGEKLRFPQPPRLRWTGLALSSRHPASTQCGGGALLRALLRREVVTFS